MDLTIKHCIAILLLLPLSLSVSAQRHKAAKPVNEPSSMRQTEARYAAELDSLKRRYANWHYAESDTLGNPYYIMLMGSPIFYQSAIARKIGTLDAPLAERHPSGNEPSFSDRIYSLVDASDSTLCSVYAQSPWVVRFKEAEQGTINIDERLKERKENDLHLVEDLFKQDEAPEKSTLPGEDLNIVVRKPNFWTFKSSLSLKFTQNHVSDNWYKGGESNNSFLASTVLQANYDNQSKITFDNKLEMKLGFQSSKNDEEHKYRTNSDLIRLTNKLGLKAVKNWYYTLMLQSWTQFYKGYKENDPKVYSDFFSPFESLLSVGMDYKLSPKNFTMNATISPLAVKLKYVDRLSLSTTYDIKEGKHSNWDFGSNITINYKWTVMKNVSWTGRIYFFTDYTKSQIEWENTFDLTINKYLSASLFLYPRFDDSQTRDPGETYFQFKELLSVGLSMDF